MIELLHLKLSNVHNTATSHRRVGHRQMMDRQNCTMNLNVTGGDLGIVDIRILLFATRTYIRLGVWVSVNPLHAMSLVSSIANHTISCMLAHCQEEVRHQGQKSGQGRAR